MRKITDQEAHPHASLVQVRNTIEVITGCTRREAASTANKLTCEQCDAIVKADGDADKVKAALTQKRKATPTQTEEEKSQVKSKPATRSRTKKRSD